MSDARKLFFPVESKQGESLRGYLIRLAEENGIQHPNWLCDIPDEMEEILGLYGTRLLGKVPRYIQSRFARSMRDHPTHKNSNDFFAFCPICISAIDHIPYYWENKLYTVCHEHGCYMEEMCPTCGKALTWDRGSIAECKCGGNLSKAAPVPACDAEVRLCKYLAAALCFEYKSQPLGQAFIPNMTLGAWELNILIAVLGRIAMGAKRCVGFGLDYVEGKVRADRLMMSQAAMLLHDWPHNFDQYLRDNLVYFDATHPEGYDVRTYERFLRDVTNCTTPNTVFLLNRYRQFAKENWPVVLTRRNTWATEEELEEQLYVPGKAAAEVLGKSLRKLKGLILNGVIEGRVKVTELGREFCIVKRESLLKFWDMSYEDVPECDAAKILGLNKPSIYKLVRAGHLDAYGGPAFGESLPSRIYKRKELYEVLKRIYSYGKAPSEEEEYLSYRMACKNILTKNEADVFLSAIVERTLPILQTLPFDGWNIGQAMFAKSDFYNWLDEQRLRESSRELCVQEVSARLRVKEEVAYFLVRNGYIASHLVTVGRRRCRRVRDVSIGDFSHQFIAAVEVAREMDTSPRSLIKRLMRKKVFPSIGPPTNGCRQVFYRRDELVAQLRGEIAIATGHH